MHDKPLSLPDVVTLSPVTSEADITALADVNEHALNDDPFKQWMNLFAERNEYDTTVKAIIEALTDPTYSVVKATVPDPERENGEKIVGFVHWMCGWIQLDQVDPFTQQTGASQRPVVDVKDVASNVAEELALKAEKVEVSTKDAARVARLRAGETKYIQMRNYYIAGIRGKKHMFVRRIMVLPEYQHRGIARRLMKVVTDEADRQKIVCWLFARAAGEKLYERAGYAVIGVTDMNEPDFGFQCSATKAMMRLPQPFVE